MRKAKSYLLLIAAVLFLGQAVITMMEPVHVEAASVSKKGWKQEKEDWYYYKNGKKQTGWLKLNGKKYYLDPKAGGQMTKGGKTIGKYFYSFARDGAMRTSMWVKDTKGRWYYFQSDGKAHTGWLTYRGKRYFLQKNGVMKTGWHTSKAGNKYYLNAPDGAMVVSATKTINGVTWKFSSKGVAKKVTHTISGNQVKVVDKGISYTLKKEFATHPGVADESLTDEELLAAVVYCEAGDQGLAGMTAVALTILNRVESSLTYYPDTLRYVIYQSGQYSVVENGSLLKRLKNPDGEEASNCRKAVKAAYNTMKKYKQNGTPRRVKGITVARMGGKKDFDCLYFMMKYSFTGLGLNWDRCDAFQYKDHVFFTKWAG